MKQEAATAAANGGQLPDKAKPLFVKKGVNFVTALVEKKQAKLVVIAHDVDPIEIVLTLPALCRKMGVPYVIVKGKARLGKVVHLKTATCLAITDVQAGDEPALAKLIESSAGAYLNNGSSIRRTVRFILYQVRCCLAHTAYCCALCPPFFLSDEW